MQGSVDLSAEYGSGWCDRAVPGEFAHHGSEPAPGIGILTLEGLYVVHRRERKRSQAVLHAEPAYGQRIDERLTVGSAGRGSCQVDPLVLIQVDTAHALLHPYVL